jgi:hypothetical protein
MHVSDDQAAEISQFVESLIINGASGRQWNCSELIDEVLSAEIPVPDDFNHYVLDFILQRQARTCLVLVDWYDQR